MSSPRVGVVRDSMLTNPLLIKASLGQTRSRGLAVPGPDFTFGTGSSLRDGGVAEVLSSWRVQSRRGDSAPHPPAVPDFVSLNRDAVKSGLVTSKELSQYRARGGGAKTKLPSPKRREGGAPRHPAAPDVTFGVTTRAASPLSDLLSHQYARRWLDEQLSRNQTSDHKQLHRVPPALDTFRDQEARLRAFRAHQSDSVSRRGHQGLGTYSLD
ncbi:cilia- and flagella-associated protein 77 isoform X2 [Xiphias gladius]|uniref:cilia- and flagella-associated protein 77 isoform X2 n=1 Tax=Xiphias gladius TaxID=8245 RepID=UPI001A9948DE|nr:cilia- and flagella-associated protein 77 isoform X2 [Xiphias gladius]